MMTVGRGSRANRIPKNIISYTYTPHEKQTTQTVSLTYTVQLTQQDRDGFSDLCSIAPFGDSPADKIGLARSSADAGDGAIDLGAVDGKFVTSNNTKTTYGRDSRELEYFSGRYTYPHKQAAGYYIQRVIYTSEGGSATRWVAPDRAIKIDSARFVDRSGRYTVVLDTIDGEQRYRGTNASAVELSWLCEVLTFYDADGNVVSYSDSWVSYTVDYTITTQNITQYGSVLMKSQIMNGAAARQGRAFQVVETEEII